MRKTVFKKGVLLGMLAALTLPAPTAYQTAIPSDNGQKGYYITSGNSKVSSMSIFMTDQATRERLQQILYGNWWNNWQPITLVQIVEEKPLVATVEKSAVDKLIDRTGQLYLSLSEEQRAELEAIFDMPSKDRLGAITALLNTLTKEQGDEAWAIFTEYNKLSKDEQKEYVNKIKAIDTNTFTIAPTVTIAPTTTTTTTDNSLVRGDDTSDTTLRDSSQVATNYEVINKPAEVSVIGSLLAPELDGEGQLGGFWVTASYGNNQSKSHLSDDIAKSKTKSKAVVLGYDKFVSGNTTIGGAFSISTSKYEAGRTDVDSDNLGLSLYGMTMLKKDWFLRYGFSYTRGDVSSDRSNPSGLAGNDDFYTADYDSDSYSFNIGVGKGFKIKENFIITPHLDFQFLRISTDGYRETGHNVPAPTEDWSLQSSRNKQNLQIITLGLDFAHQLKQGHSLNYGLYYLSQHGKRTPEAMVSHPMVQDFESRGRTMDSDAIGLKLGADFKLNERAGLKFYYNYLHGVKTKDHTFSLNLFYKI